MTDMPTIEISVEDLVILRAALNSAYHHSTVLDLGEQYRKLSPRAQSSKLTAALQNALTLAVSYIELAHAQDDAQAEIEATTND